MKYFEDLINELNNAGYDDIEYNSEFDMLIVNTFLNQKDVEECLEDINDIAWMYSVDYDGDNLITIYG